jgi:hypothetical protein
MSKTQSPEAPSGNTSPKSFGRGLGRDIEDGLTDSLAPERKPIARFYGVGRPRAHVDSLKLLENEFTSEIKLASTCPFALSTK